MKENHINTTTSISKYPGQITDLAKDAAEKYGKLPYHYLLVIGGDGSLNQALNGVKKSQNPNTPIGYFPAGTGNDFARATKLSHQIKQLVSHIKVGPKTYKIDCGHYIDNNSGKDNYFVNNLGIGFDAFIVHLANNSSMKKKLNDLHIGSMIYVLHTFKVLQKQDTFSTSVKVNGNWHHFSNTYFVTTTNHPYFGGGVALLPNASIHNHKLDTVVVEKVSNIKFLFLLAKLFINGSHVNDPHFHYYEAEKLTVKTSNPEYGQLDGEELQNQNYNLNFEISSFNLWA
ncbi:YegS/Rv2252/BmrU family lipid kinase [Lactobacillus colini]|uniref:YegS/Rv2252/BmrU family lipid kinase n=1 Tax=Lactobacillus colini TaxID=1819254 RepID=A0ABS4MDN0_9LACO|nr:YegS/Rv2252/BmrU family lipid kinase [Lactobacillus colini]